MTTQEELRETVARIIYEKMYPHSCHTALDQRTEQMFAPYADWGVFPAADAILALKLPAVGEELRQAAQDVAKVFAFDRDAKVIFRPEYSSAELAAIWGALEDALSAVRGG